MKTKNEDDARSDQSGNSGRLTHAPTTETGTEPPQLSYPGRAPVISGDPPHGSESPPSVEQATKDLRIAMNDLTYCPDEGMATRAWAQAEKCLNNLIATVRADDAKVARAELTGLRQDVRHALTLADVYFRIDQRLVRLAEPGRDTP